jgi:prevent-host-death family protein
MAAPLTTEQIGIRELKTHLSRYLKRVRAGTRLVVTDRGRSIATITPVETPPDTVWVSDLMAVGGAHWGGGKPQGSVRPPRLAGSRVSSVVLEDRR